MFKLYSLLNVLSLKINIYKTRLGNYQTSVLSEIVLHESGLTKFGNEQYIRLIMVIFIFGCPSRSKLKYMISILPHC